MSAHEHARKDDCVECAAAERESGEVASTAVPSTASVPTGSGGGAAEVVEDVMDASTFTPPDVLIGPAIVIEYCDRVREGGIEWAMRQER